MGNYEVIVSPEFKKEFYKLPNDLQERVRKILNKLETRSTGSSLKGNLKGFYSVHFNNNHYRLIYIKDDQIIKIMAVHVGKRTNDFYKKFGEEIKRRGRALS
jgi:addiction module RelE/StbE family toxin